MSASTPLSIENVPSKFSRRSACAAIGLGMALWKAPALAKQPTGVGLLTEEYALMRRAYQMGDAELLRQFYSANVIVATEGTSPVVGLEAVIASGRQILPKRRDITVEVLRVTRCPSGDALSHIAKLSAFPRDPSEPARIATAFLSWQRGAAGWRCHTEVLLIQDLSAVTGLKASGDGR
jgi:hypothetical protein